MLINILICRGYGSGGQMRRRAFRKWCSCIHEIRSILPSNTPVMALTATAVKRTKDIIVKSLTMKHPITIIASPNKSNVSYLLQVMNTSLPMLYYFKWLTEELKRKACLQIR